MNWMNAFVVVIAKSRRGRKVSEHTHMHSTVDTLGYVEFNHFTPESKLIEYNNKFSLST